MPFIKLMFILYILCYISYMTYLVDKYIINDICSNYSLHLHVYDSLYVRVSNNIYNKNRRFWSGIIHYISNYFYKIFVKVSKANLFFIN